LLLKIKAREYLPFYRSMTFIKFYNFSPQQTATTSEVSGE